MQGARCGAQVPEKNATQGGITAKSSRPFAKAAKGWGAYLLHRQGVDNPLSEPQITAEEARNRATDQEEDLHPVRMGVLSRSYRVDPDRQAEEGRKRSVQLFVVFRQPCRHIAA